MRSKARAFRPFLVKGKTTSIIADGHSPDVLRKSMPSISRAYLIRFATTFSTAARVGPTPHQPEPVPFGVGVGAIAVLDDPDAPQVAVGGVGGDDTFLDAPVHGHFVLQSVLFRRSGLLPVDTILS